MNPPPEDDPRLLAAAQEYLAALEAGAAPGRAAFAARFPELRGTLAPYLEALELLHAAAPPRPGPPPLPEGVGPFPADPLGDFRVVREVGRGGMGVVYEAVQLSLGRRVALKTLPFAAALDAKQLQRFKNEAQAAAALHHSHIVPVFAVGAERGVHYYAMQLIDGQTLTALIEQARQARAGAPATPGASTVAALQISTLRTSQASEYFRAAARLAAQAAEALEHAHQTGVVHRDIKPANLMVDGRGHLWVTDFGLAQLHDGGLTQTGDLVGTLRYMAPEQAEGRRLVDHRADVYGLGATLYELLTLEPLCPAPTRPELLRQILHDEPRPPRALDRAIPAELETVVLKAVQKDPADRYASAAELAEDLHRFLRHEPIRARRPTPLERARKWSRRHPSAVGAGVVVLLLAVVGLLIHNASITREQAKIAQEQGKTAREQEKTRAAYERERQRAEEAERRLRQTRQVVDLLIQVGAEELDDRPHLQGLRKALLETALAYYQEFLEQSAGDPAAQGKLAATERRVRQVVRDLAALQNADLGLLLAHDVVLKELGLPEGRRAEARGLSWRLLRQRSASFQDSHRLTAEERRRRWVEQAHAADAAVARLLKPGELRRLKQIALQQRGLLAFRDPEVVAALRLTPAQRQKVRALEEELWSVWPPRPPGKDHGARVRAAVSKCLAALTPPQQAQWREMAGEPFDALPPFGPAPGRPFGPR